MRVLKQIVLAAAFLEFLSPSLLAQETAASQAPGYDGLSTLWVLLAAILVFFMQAGFGMLEAGLVRAKNAANVLMKNLLDFCFAVLGFYMFGYAIMYGSEGLLFGTSGWFLMNAESPVEGLPLAAFWLFQAVFAGTAATIVSGAVAERMNFAAYLAYSFLICAFVYPTVGHWVWGGGWLAGLGFHDFAGSTVVHAVGGVTALVAAWMLGPVLAASIPTVALTSLAATACLLPPWESSFSGSVGTASTPVPPWVCRSPTWWHGLP